MGKSFCVYCCRWLRGWSLLLAGTGTKQTMKTHHQFEQPSKRKIYLRKVVVCRFCFCWCCGSRWMCSCDYGWWKINKILLVVGINYPIHVLNHVKSVTRALGALRTTVVWHSSMLRTVASSSRLRYCSRPLACIFCCCLHAFTDESERQIKPLINLHFIYCSTLDTRANKTK